MCGFFAFWRPMPTTLHVGKHRVQTVLGSDASVIPVGTLTASSSNNNLVTALVDPATNNGTITGIAVGSPPVNVTYAAPGYVSTVQQVTVLPLPTIVVTDGAEV